TGTRPEDHEEVCARTEVPPSGNKATTCTHWQYRLRNPPTHIPDCADPGSLPPPNPCRPADRGGQPLQPGTNRSRAQSAVPGNARRRRRGNELTWRSAAGVLTCRAYPWPPYLGSCPPTTQRVDVCA
ncbi:hypothetical protein C8Q76DRAFT_755534, partial [Earliella scabrosa]